MEGKNSLKTEHSQKQSEYSGNYCIQCGIQYSQIDERHPWRQNGLSVSSHWDWLETRPSIGRFHLSRDAAWSCCCPQGSDGLARAQSGTPENVTVNISLGYASHLNRKFKSRLDFNCHRVWLNIAFMWAFMFCFYDQIFSMSQCRITKPH